MSDDDKSEKKRATLAQMVREMRENMAAQIEFEQLSARLTRAKFIALVEQGFTEAQALELCKR